MPFERQNSSNSCAEVTRPLPQRTLPLSSVSARAARPPSGRRCEARWPRGLAGALPRESLLPPHNPPSQGHALPTRLAHHHVTHHRHPHFSFLRPACLSMAFNVPGGTSRLGLPATVTVPGLLGCLSCRWLPRVRASCHPSSARSRSSSPTFTPPRHRSRSRVTFAMSSRGERMRASGLLHCGVRQHPVDHFFRSRMTLGARSPAAFELSPRCKSLGATFQRWPLSVMTVTVFRL